jgi:hypothetical protein
MDTTHALFGGEVDRKLSNLLALWAASGSSHVGYRLPGFPLNGETYLPRGRHPPGSVGAAWFNPFASIFVT